MYLKIWSIQRTAIIISTLIVVPLFTKYATGIENLRVSVQYDQKAVLILALLSKCVNYVYNLSTSGIKVF